MRRALWSAAAVAGLVAASGSSAASGAATSCGSLVGDPQLTPAYRVDMESARRTITFGDSLVLVVRYSVDGGGCPSDTVLPEFRARAFGSRFFMPVRLASAPLTGGPIGFVPAMWWAAPTVATTYRAVWRGALSNGVTVAVRPAVSFRRSGRAGIVSVRAARSFAGRALRIDARTGTGWRPAGRARIGRGDTARFRLPHTDAVRVRVPAIPGYVGAVRILRLRP